MGLLCGIDTERMRDKKKERESFFPYFIFIKRENRRENKLGERESKLDFNEI
jgi:hypothetical protein